MAAKKLGIGRATLYRHLNPSKKLPRTDPRQLPLYKDEDGNSKD
jgi:predicted DNA-binding transcriptional regulator AlpA